MVEGGKSLPEGLVAARQQSRREHVETIRTMLAHVPCKLSSIKDIGTVDDFRRNGGPIHGSTGPFLNPFFFFARLRAPGGVEVSLTRVCPGAFLGAGPVAVEAQSGNGRGRHCSYKLSHSADKLQE